MWRTSPPIFDLREDARETLAYAKSVCRACTLVRMRTGDVKEEAREMTALARALKPISTGIADFAPRLWDVSVASK